MSKIRTPRLVAIGIAATSACALHAAPSGVWHGPGPQACRGLCSMEWAVGEAARHIDPHALAEAMQAPRVRVYVTDGAAILMNTGAQNREAFAVHSTTVAALGRPEEALGWAVGDVYFLQVAGCTNWQVVARDGVHRVPQLTAATSATSAISSIAFGSGLSWSASPPPWTYDPPRYVRDPADNPDPIDPPPPTTPVPAPAAMWLCIVGLMSLTRWRRK